MTEQMENLTRAQQAARLTADSLSAALASAGAVQGLVLMPLIERAATLAADIERMLHAVHDDDMIDAAILAKAKEPTT